jgi:hypothetical protein
MKANRAFGELVDKCFFVKELNPRLIIAAVSFGIGLAADIGLIVYRKVNETCFLNQYGPLPDMAIRFVVCLGVTVIFFTAASGIYNFWKWKI